ncbi:hypothetical protein SAMD00019534_101510, partial [Acytostelium subglobosum LB1]|uniref:hypothetical protein n=1 Tax=Acytostelium subglobosum LB1 TaxID=1410327 RepID=UPI0006448CF7
FNMSHDENTQLLDQSKELTKDDINKITTRNVNIMVLIVFLSSIGFTLVMPSLYDYLNQNKDYVHKYYGLVTAIYSFGQLVSSPGFGYWGNRRPKIESIIIATIISLIGNGLYGFTYELGGVSFIPVISLSRFIVGVGSGRVAVCRAYASERTEASKKTQTMGRMSGAQGAGFVIGPIIGYGLSHVDFKVGNIVVNKFTAPGFASVILNIISMVIVLLWFKEQSVPEHPQSFNQSINNDTDDNNFIGKAQQGDNSPQQVLLPVFVSNYMFGVILSDFSVFESILTAMTLHFYNWGPSDNGLLLTFSGVVSVMVFIVISTPIVKRFEDRKMAMFGYINLVVALLFLAAYDNGPFDFEKGLPKWQLFVGAVFVSIGYPIASSMVYAIYSKILSPEKQGTKMGWLTSGGSFARMIGPLWANALFNIADDVLYLTCAAFTVTGIVALCLFYKQLEPRPEYSSSSSSNVIKPDDDFEHHGT